jgi:drug/metabolite transporter (DMT)-like permease
MSATLMSRGPVLSRNAIPGNLPGIAVGLAAASIGALYTVYARWGIAHGLHSPDLTVLRFGVAGLVTMPILLRQLRTDPAVLLDRWKIWLAVSVFAGTPFGLLIFGALQFAPPSHAAVFPFAAMSVGGMLISALVFHERLAARRIVGIALVVGSLLAISGLDPDSLTARSLIGDAMFVVAGLFWAGFGILLRRHRLDPILATAAISFSALVTYVPGYLIVTGGAGLIAAAPSVLWTEVLVQGLIAGVGTLFAYAKMVALLGPSRAAVFPALAPGLASLMAWPVLGHVPTLLEGFGLTGAMIGLLISVTAASR